MDPVYKVGEQSADDPFRFVMSTDAVDRQGDIIEQRGWVLRDFRKNPIALYQHNSNFPIGTWKDVRIEDGRLMGSLQLAKAGTSRMIDEIRSLLEQRVLKAVSVGFQPTKAEPIEGDRRGGIRFLKQMLLECSVVSVPANHEALVQRGLDMGVSKQTLDMLTQPDSLVSERYNRNAVLGVPRPRKSLSRGNPMKLGDKIKDAESRLNDMRDDVAAIVKAAEDQGRDLLDDETDQIEALNDDIAALEKSLEGLMAAETAINKRRADREVDRAPGTPAMAKREDGSVFTKAAVVAVLAHQTKKAPDQVLVERYSHDHRVGPVYGMLAKAASTPAATDVDGWAQQLVDTEVASFINELEPVSVYGAMAAGGTGIPFGNNVSVSMPSRSGQGNVSGSFVGENASIPVKQDHYGAKTLHRYKAAVISTFSQELARTSTPQIEALLRSAIVQDTGDMLDSVLLDPSLDTVAAIRPASPFFGADTAVSAGDTLADILTDLKFLLNTLSSANAGRNPRIVMNPARLTGLSMLTNVNGSFVFRDEIGQGRLMGVPLIVSTNCPATTVFIIDLADFATAFGTPEFMASDQATIVMADDDGVAPTMADTNAVNDAGGSLHVSDAAGTTPPTVVRSMFQTWSTALRMVMPISWGTVRDGTSAYITGATW